MDLLSKHSLAQLKNIFCGVEDLFTNFDHLNFDQLDLGLDNFHTVVLNVNNNLNPCYYNKTSEIHALRLIYKTKSKSNPNIRTYYAIGQLLHPSSNGDEFSVDPLPIIYAFSVSGLILKQTSYSYTVGTFEDFCQEAPPVISVDSYVTPIHLLNEKDGDWLADAFSYAKKNKSDIKTNSLLASSELLELKKHVRCNMVSLINHLHYIYREKLAEKRGLLQKMINTEVEQVFDSSPENTELVKTCSKILKAASRSKLTLKSSESNENTLEERKAQFKKDIDEKLLISATTHGIDLMISSKDKHHPIYKYINNPSDMTLGKLLSRLLADAKNNHNGFALLFNSIALMNSVRDSEQRYTEILKGVHSRPSIVENPNLLELIESKLNKVDQSQVVQAFMNMEASTAIEHVGDSIKIPKNITINELDEPNTSKDSDSSELEVEPIAPIDIQDQIEIEEQGSELPVPNETLEQELPEPEAFKPNLSQNTFNAIDCVAKEDLALAEIVSGSTQIPNTSLDSLFAHPYFMKAYNHEKNCFEIQTHIISFLYKEYFAKNKNEKGLINYLGFGHEVLFNGNEFIIQDQTNIYALHQRKGALTSCAVSDFVEFDYQAPYPVYFTTKQTSPQINNTSPSSKKLLKLTTEMHKDFGFVAESIANDLSKKYKEYLETSNLESCIQSAVMFLGLDKADANGLDIDSITIEYREQLLAIHELYEPDIDEPTENSQLTIDDPFDLDESIVNLNEPDIDLIEEIANEDMLAPHQLPPMDVIRAQIQGNQNNLHVASKFKGEAPKTIYVDPAPDQDLEEIQTQKFDFNLGEITFIHTNNGEDNGNIGKPVGDINTLEAVSIAPQDQMVEDGESNITSFPTKAARQPISDLEDMHPFMAQLCSPQLVDHTDFKYWHLDSDIGQKLCVGISRKLVTVGVEGFSQSMDIVFNKNEILEKEFDYSLLCRVTSKATAKKIRKFIKVQIQQDLLNCFKAI